MKRAVIGTATALAIVGGGFFVALRTTQPSNSAPSTSTATVVTTYEQPSVIPPPIKEAEKESTNGQAVDATGMATTTRTGEVVRSPRRSARDDGAVQQSGSAGIAVHGRAEALVTAAATDDPYHDSMLPGGSKWTTSTDIDASANVNVINANPTTAARTQQAVPATAISANRAAMPSAVSSTTTSDPRCATIAPDFQQDCATANRWLQGIGTQYGAQTQRHYRWLSAARVDDWLKNGCAPSPCTFDGTGAAIGRIPPTDYFGAQGYDSPLGTCHSTTPTALHYEAACGEKDDTHGCSAARVNSTQLALGGVIEDDGKVHGLVRWAGDGMFYEGTIADVACANGCSVEFDHPCSLPQPNAQPFVYRGPTQTNGKSSTVYSWWYGEDPRAPGPWAAGWMAEER